MADTTPYTFMPSHKSEFEIHKDPTIQVTVEGNDCTYSLPVSDLRSDSKRVEFITPPFRDSTDIGEILIVTTFKVVKEAAGVEANLGKAVDAYTDPLDESQSFPAVTADKVYPANNFGHSIFKSIDWKICGTRVTPQTEYHHIRSYLDGEFYGTKEQKDTYWYSRLWNVEESKRFECIKESREFTTVTALNLDPCQQPKHLIPNCPMQFVFNINSDKVIFKVDTTSSAVVPKLKLIGMKLILRRFQLNKGCAAGIESGLQVKPAKYYHTRTDVDVHHIPQGVTKYVQDMVFKNDLPRLIIIGIQPNEVLTGTYTSDCFEFAPNGLKYLAGYLNGRLINGIAYTPDFTNDNTQFEHYMLYSATGQTHERPQMHITHKRFKSTHAFYAFNLSADYTNHGPENGNFDLIPSGTVKFEFEFDAATPKPLNYICYSHYNTWLDITGRREVKLPS